MHTHLTSKGQVTVPKRICDALQLLPGMLVTFALTANGQVVIRPANVPWAEVQSDGSKRAPVMDRFEAARGKADICWRTDVTRDAQRFRREFSGLTLLTP